MALRIVGAMGCLWGNLHVSEQQIGRIYANADAAQHCPKGAQSSQYHKDTGTLTICVGASQGREANGVKNARSNKC